MNVLIGKRIRNLRKQKGLSQEAVADYLHVSQSTYARIENGESHSWASYIEPISKLFEIQPEELIKQESVVINHNQKGGGGYIQINQHPYEMLIQQYEQRLKEKDEIISLLRSQLKK